MTILNEFESKKLLKEFGIKIPNGSIAKYDDIVDNFHQLVSKMQSEKFVLKIVSDDIPHKSDVGGVVLGVSKEEIYNTYYTMLNNVYYKLPQAKIDGIFIQEMITPGIECIIGVKEDSQFGKVIMFGFGGIYTEIFKDISMRILPITKKDVEEMIFETKISKVLKGYRGKKYDLEGVINTILKVSEMTNKYNIKELDINPLVVHENDSIALDARIKI